LSGAIKSSLALRSSFAFGARASLSTENAINTAVRKRRALSDDADAPRFIVTIPARGHRFIASVLVPSHELKPAGFRNAELESHENGSQLINDKSVDFPQPDVVSEENQLHFGRYGLVGLLSIAGLALIVSVVLAMNWRWRRRRGPCWTIRERSRVFLPGRESI
jgi:hypothetical protein